MKHASVEFQLEMQRWRIGAHILEATQPMSYRKLFEAEYNDR